jgi:integrase
VLAFSRTRLEQASAPQVYTLADATGERYRALVLLAAFSSLRWGQLAALRRSDIDVQARTVKVVRQLNERHRSGSEYGPPKSDAGQRERRASQAH